MTAKVKILDVLYNPDVFFIRISIGSRVKFERVDESHCLKYRTTIRQAVEAAALDYADEVNELVYGVTYE